MEPKTLLDFTDKIKELNLDTDNVYLVDFFASWCKPCKQLSNYLDEKLKNINIFKINVDNSDFNDYVDSFDVDELHTIIVFKKGNFYTKIIGFNTDLINEAIA
jgi:thioredoxin 1